MLRVNSRIRDYIKNYVMNKSPGVFILLNRVVRERLGMDLVDAIIKKPRDFLKLLKSFYGDEMEAAFIYRSLFLKALAVMAGDPELDKELFKAAMNGCSQLVAVLRSHGVDVSTEICED